ncbi:Fe-S cluster assembly protein HesB [Edaphobacillus lindanitolerans]|uniref:Fe-S cluster assembly iron-binding protein IscA n=1 Tax=Edaphobacillus lindanitolerans TaxID=550447 RepID=A0A1U7PSV3_9BACI|nr:Fe-S cluster assembly protein HesB [Edaphobacillus lindanitolerans]SIT91824.1 hypothetical protein SAMN05428946_2743 [Edaphobacillus lindanitolerans]
MNISPEGKAYLTQVLSDQSINTIRFYGVSGCCGVNLGAEIAAASVDDEIVVLDGINLAVDPQVKSLLTDVTIHAEESNGEMGISLVGYAPRCC